MSKQVASIGLFCLVAVFRPVPCLCAGDGFDLAPINYSSTESSDRVAQLGRRMASGEIRLERDSRYGYLPSLLSALDIPVESQVLVFSKTSLQIHKISPTNPRALYFNDSVYVGYVPGSDTLELAANDPQLGAVFYTMDCNRDDPSIDDANATASSAESETGEPRLLRDRGQCLSCHATSRTENVPGYLVRSIYPDRAGRPRTGASSYTTDDRSPWEQRWGGWYVTGSHGSMRHMGNVFAVDRQNPQKVDLELGANQSQLPERVKGDLHMRPHSDLVALMVLEHQSHVHNLITRANFETRQAIHMDETMNKALDRPKGFRSESTERRIASVSQALVDSILMQKETRLSAPIAGTGGFQDVFGAKGPRTRDGRSLRELDLQTRLFRFPCSFLVYSPEFQQLPEPVLVKVNKRLKDILSDPSLASEYGMSDEARTSIREILAETLPTHFGD